MMQDTINIKELRALLPKIVEEVKRGKQFTVFYKSRPAFRIVPLNDVTEVLCPLEQDPLYRAGAIGESSDGLAADNHDAILYGNTSK